MKKTAKTLVILVVVAISLVLVSGTALASEYDHCAGALQSLGLFKGAATGFELDRQATRAEAAVMLVRLLGAEEDAINGDYSHPFTDVPEWASPHIAYMYETGLTKGTGETTFTPQDICDIQMYSTFILRALGYEEGEGDFTYADATEFAYKLGVVDIITGSGDFLRDNMAAISYTALFAPPKGAETTLLQHLVEQGAVKEDAAEPYLSLLADYAQMRKAYFVEGLGTAIPLECELSLAMKMDMGEEGALDINYSGLLQMDISELGEPESMEDILGILDKIKFGIANKIALAGVMLEEELDTEIGLDLYLLDGTIYLDMDLGEALELPIPAKIKLSIPELLAEVSGLLGDLGDLQELFAPGLDMQSLTENILAMLPDDSASVYYGIAWVKELKITESADGGLRIDVTHCAFSNEMIHDIATMVYSGIPEIMDVLDELEYSIGDMKFVYFLDKDDVLTGFSYSMTI
ncbi:MAG: S-layer homology domain-containing protein, partial [Clostridiales bacterium]|nr:S-layer homology domain-containing protein [Clostridiales bacterium]